jgi:hypothetical protein
MVRIDGWTETAESPPPAGLRVLVWCDCFPHENPLTVGACVFGRWTFDFAYDDGPAEPRYWMPLPDGPPGWRYRDDCDP